MSENWKIFLGIPGNRNKFIITLSALIIILFALTRFLNYIETRDGFIPVDPVISTVPPVDLTWLIFTVIYFSLFIAVYFLLQSPPGLMAAMQCYGLMVIFRMVLMYFVPLDPPPGMIPLADPFVEIFGTGKLLTKDLFFSGHTATLLILYYTAESKKLKFVFLLSTILVAVSVVLQHVHYSVDILGAVFFTWLAYILTRKMNESRGILSAGLKQE
jgi:membrane-associated phospholipid phosphatase